MRKSILVIFIAILGYNVFAQYKSSLDKGIEFEKKEKFYEAIQMYNAANLSWDKPVMNEVDKRIIRCTEQLDSLLKKAKENEIRAIESEKLAIKNALNAQRNISEVLKSQADRATIDCVWGDALLYIQKAYEMFPDNENLDASIRNALNKFIPEVAIFWHPKTINDMLFSPDGKYLITASGKTIQVLNLSTFKNEYVLRGFGGEVTAIAFSESSDILMSFSNDRIIRFWNLKNGTEIAKWRHYFYSGEVLNKVAFDVSRNFYIMASDSYVYIKSLDSNNLLGLIQGHKHRITSFSYSPEKHMIVSCAADEESESIRINDISDIKIGQIRFLRSFASQVDNVEMQSSGNYLVYSSKIAYGSISIYDISNNIIKNVISEKGMLGQFNLNSKENLLSYFYRVDNDEFPIYLYDLSNLSSQTKRGKLDNHNNIAVTMCRFSLNGDFLASVDAKNYVRLWSLKKKNGVNLDQNLANACYYGLSYLLDSSGSFISRNLDSLLIARRNSDVNWLPEAIKKQTSMFVGNDNDLMKYLSKGPYSKAKTIVEGRADLSYRNETGSTPLIYTLITNRPEIVNSIKVCKYPEDFLFVMSLNDSKIIRNFLENGADVNSTNSFGETALHLAAANGNLEIVKLLIEKYGANINAKTIRGTTPLMTAMQERSEEIANYLLAHNPELNVKESEWGLTEIMRASLEGYSGIVQELINRKVNVNEKDFDGKTSLMYVVESSNNEILKLLINGGAYTEILDLVNEAAPLYIAVLNGNLEGCRLLLEAGANVNANSKYNVSPLEAASSLGFLDIVRLLLEYGAEVKHEDINNRSALDYAIENHHEEIVSVLSNLDRTRKSSFHFDKYVQFRGIATNYLGFSQDGCILTITKEDSVNYSCEIKYDGNRLVGLFKSITGVESTNSANTTSTFRVFQFQGYEYCGIKGDHSSFQPGTNCKCSIQLAITPQGACSGVYHLGLVADQTDEQYGTYDLKLINYK